jgi:hypothetical protein
VRRARKRIKVQGRKNQGSRKRESRKKESRFKVQGKEKRDSGIVCG